MAIPQPSESQVAGTQLGRYTLLGKLAMGGMAEVFLARQAGPMGFAKTVVVKRILPQFAGDQEFLQMFFDEARLAALINHPHVVQIFELGEDPETRTFFMAMEYIDGRNLKQVATRALELGGQLSMRLAARVISDAASGLEFAHSLKDAHGQPLHMVHRDISAENILWSYSGLVKVVDFGIAKAAHMEGRTRTGQVKGKFSYMAPEQLLGQTIDRRTDVWALGITLYWLLSGQRPFRGDSEARIIQQIISEKLPPLERRGTPVPEGLEQLVRKALEKDPRQRFQTAGEFQEALDDWILEGGEPVSNASLAGFMEQLFPERTDKDRVLTQALLQGEIQPQDTPWKTRLAKQEQRSSSRLAPAPAPATKGSPSWLGPVLGVSVALLALVGGVIGWDLFVRDPEVLPPAHPVGVQPDPLAFPTPTRRAPPPRDADPDALPPPRPAPTPTTVAGEGSPPLPVPTPAPEPAPREGGTIPSIAPLPTPSPTVGLGLNLAPAPADVALPGPAPTPANRDRRGRAHKSQDPAPEAGPPGKLEIEVRPWASVIIDGRRIGTTPMAPLNVPAGKHRIELVNEDLNVHVVRLVEIRSGETSSLQEKLGGDSE